MLLSYRPTASDKITVAIDNELDTESADSHVLYQFDRTHFSTRLRDRTGRRAWMRDNGFSATSISPMRIVRQPNKPEPTATTGGRSAAPLGARLRRSTIAQVQIVVDDRNIR